MNRNAYINVMKPSMIVALSLVSALMLSLVHKPRIAMADDSVNVVFTNSTPISINTVAPAPTAAALYPSTVNVSGMTGTTTKVTITLTGLSHQRTPDIDMLLVSPTGAKFVMMSDVGAGAASNVTLTLDDSAPQALPPATVLTSGSFRPTSFFSGTDVFPSPAPATPYLIAPSEGSSAFSDAFNSANPNGTWSLYVVDDALLNSGDISGGWGINITSTGSAATSFTNSSSIAINDVTSVVAQASLYPSQINISGVTGSVTDLNVTLTGLSHTRPGDIDVLLVSSNGLQQLLMSDVPVNNTSAISNLTFTFDDSAPGNLPFAGPLSSGTYRTTNFNTGTEAFPSPAPSPPYASGALADFNGVSPNGVWSLYIVDDLEGESGSLSGGWSLDITTAPFVPPTLGCGSPSFSGPTNYAAGTGPTGSAVGDFNNDTKQDLAITNQSSNNVSILLGDGLGGFSAPANFTAGTNPYAVAVGLINNDTNQDLVVVNSGSNNVSVLLGDGSGGFSAPTNYGVGPSPISVAIADLNNDTKADLAVAEFGTFFLGTVSILLNNGTGTFGPPISLAARTQPSAVAIGEFSGDVNLDLAVANFGSNNVSIFLGNGNGTFNTVPVVSASAGPVSIAIADFNADSEDDLAIVNYNSDNVSIRLGVGNGTFTSGGTFAVGANPISIQAKEFNGDPRLDLVVANRSSNDVSVLLGNGPGSFSPALRSSVGSAPGSVVVGEFNGNTQFDIATANTGSANASVLLNSCAVAKGTRFDFTGDRRTDLAVFRPSDTNWFVFFSEGGGGFSFTLFGSSTDILVPDDYSGDGKTDIAVFRPSTAVWLVQGLYNLQFGLAGDVPAPADFDGDHRADIAVFRPSDGNWYIRRSTDNTWITVPFGTNGDKPVPRDFDGDDKADVAVFRPSNSTWYIMRSSNNQVIGVPFGISTDKPVATDYDGDGKADIAVFRPSDGIWYIMSSSNGSVTGTSWGLSTDIPAPGDYDGDGKFDIAVFRPSTGFWYVLRSTSSTLDARKWGQNGDIPIPSTNIP